MEGRSRCHADSLPSSDCVGTEGPRQTPILREGAENINALANSSSNGLLGVGRGDGKRTPAPLWRWKRSTYTSNSLSCSRSLCPYVCDTPQQPGRKITRSEE